MSHPLPNQISQGESPGITMPKSRSPKSEVPPHAAPTVIRGTAPQAESTKRPVSVGRDGCEDSLFNDDLDAMGQLGLVDYVAAVKRTGLLRPESVDAALRQLTPQQRATSDREAINHLGLLLIKRGLMTPWHHQRILAGQTRGFYVGKYTLLGHLGTGGMSSVYLAVHTRMQRRVAIKVLPPERARDSSYLGRFYIEGRAIAALDHANIVRAFDIDNQGELHYLVMEYVPGRDLHTLVAHDGPLDPKRAAEYIRQAALGLQYAHRRGLVHRDVKPANLLVDQTETVKLLDLGLARLKTVSQSLTLLHQENVLGTADYLAPEQALDSHGADHRADIYGLGCTFYFLLSGHPPFPTGNVSQRLMAHQRQQPRSLFDIRADMPQELESLIGRMMAKKPQSRPQTAHDVALFLEEWLIAQGAPKTIRLTGSSRAPQESSQWNVGDDDFFVLPAEDGSRHDGDAGVSSLFRDAAKAQAKQPPSKRSASSDPRPAPPRREAYETWSNRTREHETVMQHPPAMPPPVVDPTALPSMEDAPNLNFASSPNDWLLERAGTDENELSASFALDLQRRDQRAWLSVGLILTAAIGLGLALWLGHLLGQS